MKHIFTVTIFALLLFSCAKDNPNLIAKNKLGPLSNATKIHEIEALLVNDSVVVQGSKESFGSFVKTSRFMEVYNKNGDKQYVIEPVGDLDTISLIKTIRLFSDAYKTKNNIGYGSSFGDLKAHHDVSDIQSSLKSVIISLEDLNAVVSFDRDVLPDDVKYDIDADITPIMIPDEATINRFWLNFEIDDSKNE